MSCQIYLSREPRKVFQARTAEEKADKKGYKELEVRDLSMLDRESTRTQVRTFSRQITRCTFVLVCQIEEQYLDYEKTALQHFPEIIEVGFAGAMGDPVP